MTSNIEIMGLQKLFQTIADYFICFEQLSTVSNYLKHLALDYNYGTFTFSNIKLKAKSTLNK